ncbi:MAG: hypothetical protein COB93_02500 [Sneathiella sp.]|nr:MAG: hypothetical protein COB93_02500 [Sneathiella sp.]
MLTVNHYADLNQAALFDAMRIAKRKLKEAAAAMRVDAKLIGLVENTARELGLIYAADQPGLWFYWIDRASCQVLIGQDTFGERTGVLRKDVNYC